MKLRWLALVGVVLFTAACQSQPRNEPAPSPSRTATSSLPPSGSPPAPGACEPKRGGSENYVWLRDVTVETGNGSDTVTFQFEAAEDTEVAPAVPRFELAPATGPFVDDGEGRPLEVAGSSHFKLIFHGAAGAHTEGERVVETYKGPKEFKPSFAALTELELSGDFEATMSWIAGMQGTSCPEPKVDDAALRMTLEFPH